MTSDATLSQLIGARGANFCHDTFPRHVGLFVDVAFGRGLTPNARPGNGYGRSKAADWAACRCWCEARVTKDHLSGRPAILVHMREADGVPSALRIHSPA